MLLIDTAANHTTCKKAMQLPALCPTAKPKATSVSKIICVLKNPTKPTHFVDVSETVLYDALIGRYTPGNVATMSQ